MTKKEVLAIFRKTGGILNGHFKLSSGLHSGQYLQCARVLQHPRYAEKLCGTLARKFKTTRPDIVIAPALGGILVSYEVGKALKAKSVFTERVDGKMALRRGFEINRKERVLVVEDVITTGLSTKEVIDAVKNSDGTVVGVGSIIDRSDMPIDFGVPSHTLARVKIKTFKEDNCPLCKKNIPITKPGSRQ